jgi:hypothetical protein
VTLEKAKLLSELNNQPLCNYLAETLKVVDLPEQSKEILLSSVFGIDDVLTVFSYIT